MPETRTSHDAAHARLFTFGSKAETLQTLKGRLTQATVPDSYFFSIQEWQASRPRILQRIRDQFQGAKLAVRSSALIEDGANESMAGAFLSLQHVNGASPGDVTDAITRVMQSMTGNPQDQVLVQPMIEDIAVNGVIMTYDMVHGTPYYCIDFDDESGRTDTITGGSVINKGLFVYRHAEPGLLRSPRILRFLQLAKELESLCACLALDIEFGLDRTGKLYLFQVRRMARARHWHPVTERRVARQLEFVERFVQECSLPREGVVGERTILAIMPDWNPAELIGTTPQPLSSSLYRTLITRSTWREARAEMGYQELGDGELMYLINSHPYIDVRMSFNSFLPEGLDRDTGGKLVSAWMNRLESCPELHDKIEFDIVPTCLDFCFEHDFSERYPNILSTAEREQYTQALRILTRNAIGPKQDSTLDRALELAAQLDALRLTDVNHAEPHAFLVRASHLLKACRRLGVKPFAVAARHAFIAEALLRSAVRRNGLRQERLDEFKRSIRTITGNIVNEYSQVCHGEISREDFLTRYGHLRPGTYEITSLRYDERDDLFHDQAPQLAHSTTPVFSMNEDECTAIDGLLRECGLDVLNSRQLLAYAARAIAAREQIKFIFSRTLSNALSDLVSWGEKIGLSREDLSFLDWASIESSLTVPPMDFLDRHYLAQVAASRIQMEAAHEFKLAHIIFSVRDIYVATLNRSIPNFVGTGAASGRIVKLTAEMSARVNIQGMIVCIENADPGFDWIFTQHPAALVTRFGGANSHMAIRCAEFGLPAAIGCGDSLYARLTQAGAAELNCAEKILRPLHAK